MTADILEHRLAGPKRRAGLRIGRWRPALAGLCVALAAVAVAAGWLHLILPSLVDAMTIYD